MIRPLIGIGADILVTPGKREKAFSYLTYVNAVLRADAVPLVIPPQPENLEMIIGLLDGVLLAGGNDCDPACYGEERHPTVDPMDQRRQQNDVLLAKLGREHGIPTLGICLGAQVMNVSAGGNLIQDIGSAVPGALQHESDSDDRVRHDVAVEAGTKLGGILGERQLNVNSSHHQSIRELGEGLRVTAAAPDGVVEGIEDPDHPFYLGVQWHPEDMNGEHSASSLFGAFVEAAREHASRRKRAR